MSHVVACLVDPHFEGFRGAVCPLHSIVSHSVTGAQLFLVVLVPAEQVYTVINFGKKDPPKIYTISIYIFVMYLISTAPHLARVAVGQLDLNSNDTSPLCLPFSANIHIYTSLFLSLIQTLFPLTGTLIAVKVRSVAKKIYRSYADRRSKLTLDERLEIEGAITAAKAVSAISATAALVYPYNMLLRVYGINAVCHGDAICMSVVYALAYSSAKCITTSVLLFVLGFEMKEVRRKIRRSLGIRSNKVLEVTVKIEDCSKEANTRFTYLQNQWGSVKTN